MSSHELLPTNLHSIIIVVVKLTALSISTFLLEVSDRNEAGEKFNVTPLPLTLPPPLRTILLFLRSIKSKNILSSCSVFNLQNQRLSYEQPPIKEENNFRTKHLWRVGIGICLFGCSYYLIKSKLLSLIFSFSSLIIFFFPFFFFLPTTTFKKHAKIFN